MITCAEGKSVVMEPAKMSDKEFRLFSDLIYKDIGIKMPPAKRVMLTVRLNRRLKDLKIDSYDHYYNYLLTSRDRYEEYNKMIDAVTTNKTEFFREPAHFSILLKDVLPELVERKSFRNREIINLWCAGCSTGEEAYTLAMVLTEFFTGTKSGDFRIIATDISRRVLNIAVDAVYEDNALENIPPQLCRKYLMRGKGDKDGYHRIVPELRKKVSFYQLNFMDEDYNIKHPVDIVFCRNVVIYFDKQTQKNLFAKIHRYIVPDGYLFIGSSESLYGITNDFRSIGPTVYKRV